jgi:hypothetical protein
MMMSSSSKSKGAGLHSHAGSQRSSDTIRDAHRNGAAEDNAQRAPHHFGASEKCA